MAHAAVAPVKTLAHNEARAALVVATVDAIARHGGAALQPNQICNELGLSRSLVNFHFGGRDGLIAEAMELGYVGYVDALQLATEAAGEDPLDRLFAWTDRQIEWTIENPGLAAALNFQNEASGMQGPMPEEVAGRLAATGVRNFNFLMDLVREVRQSNGVATDTGTVGFDSAVVGWLTLGLSVWLAGRHGPTQQFNDPDLVKMAKDRSHRLIMGMLGV